MTPDALVTGIRIYVLAVACVTAALGTFQIPRWKTYLIGNQLAWISLALFNGAMIFGIAEQLVVGTPGGYRTYLSALAVTFALYAVAYTPGRRLLRWWRARRIINRKDKP